MEHIRGIYPYFDDPYFAFYMPHALWFIRSRGHKTIDKYMFLDRMKVNNVIFSPYDGHRETHPFEEICWYSGWIICGHGKVYRHLSEMVKRQYMHVPDILRHPQKVAHVNVFGVDQHFYDFLLHVTHEDDWGLEVESPWSI